MLIFPFNYRSTNLPLNFYLSFPHLSSPHTPSPAFLLRVSPYYLHFPFSPPSTSLLLPKTSAASPRHSPSPSPSLSPQSPSPSPRRRPVWCLSGLISGWWIVLIGSRYQLNSSGTTLAIISRAEGIRKKGTYNDKYLSLPLRILCNHG